MKLKPMSVEEIRDVILASDPGYRAAFLSMFQSGMGAHYFGFWNRNGWEKLEKDLGKALKIIKINFRTRMSGRSFHTYIGGDAVEAIRKYLPNRDGAREAFEISEKRRMNRTQRRGETYIEKEFETAIFYNKIGAPITTEALKKYWFNMTVRLGLVEPKGDGNAGTRYGKNPHEMRSVFFNQLTDSGVSSSIIHYFLGHVGDRSRDHGLARMDENRTRPAYEKAVPYLQIISSEVPFSLFKDENFKSTLEELERELDRLKEVGDR